MSRAAGRVEVRSEHARGAGAARRLRASARRFLGALELSSAALSVLVTGDEGIRSLNRAWRGVDRPTDVLSFPAAPPPPLAPGRAAGPGGRSRRPPRALGDVAISLDTARRAAREEGRAVGALLDRYLAHGLLHLLGHDHHRPAERRRMAAAEDALVGEGLVRAARRRDPAPRPAGRARGQRPRPPPRGGSGR